MSEWHGKNVVVVDCEAPMGVGAPSVGDMTEFGAAIFQPETPYYAATYHGKPESVKRLHRDLIWHDAIVRFEDWLRSHIRGRAVFVSDNPAYDFQWINFYFWRVLGRNPFGHSARRIGDFYAGLTGDFHNTQAWKRLRITKHDHNPVHDAIGNCEALGRMLKGERV